MTTSLSHLGDVGVGDEACACGWVLPKSCQPVLVYDPSDKTGQQKTVSVSQDKRVQIELITIDNHNAAVFLLCPHCAKQFVLQAGVDHDN